MSGATLQDRTEKEQNQEEKQWVKEQKIPTSANKIAA